MSNAVLNDVWQHAPVNGNELLVLLVLADMADEDNRWCWPSVATVCRKSRMGRSTAYRALNTLRDLGVIEDVPEQLWPTNANRYASIVRRIRPVEAWASSNSSQIGTGVETASEEEGGVPDRDGGSPSLGDNPLLNPHGLETQKTTSSLSPRRGRVVATQSEAPKPRRESKSRAARRAAEAVDLSDPFVALADLQEPEESPAQPETRTKPISAAQQAVSLVNQFRLSASAKPGAVPGQTNDGALRRQFRTWLAEGTTEAQIRNMVTTYWSNAWDGQRSGHKAAWQDFLASRGSLVAAVEKSRQIDAERPDDSAYVSGEIEVDPDRYDDSKW